MTLNDKIRKKSQEVPNKIAIIDRNGITTYSDLYAEIKYLSNSILNATIPRSRILIIISNSKEFVISFYSCLHANCIPCPLDIDITLNQFIEQLKYLKPNGVIIEERIYNRFNKFKNCNINIAFILVIRKANSYEEIRSNLKINFENMTADLNNITKMEPHSICQIVNSSGTTGKPKGVILTHNQVLIACNNIIENIGIKSTDIEINSLPLSRLFGQLNLHSHLIQGASIIIEPGLSNPENTLRQLLKYRATSFPHVPSGFITIMYNFPELFKKCDQCLRYLMLCSMPISVENIDRLRKLLPTTEIINTYGLTEAARCTFLNITKNPEKAGSVGKASKYVEIVIIDEDENPLKAGQKGEIIIKAKHCFEGYWEMPEKTLTTLKNGYLYTQDIGYLDDDGYLYIVGRKDNVINCGGKKFNPEEIELYFTDNTGKINVAIVPSKDPIGRLGEIPFAFILKDYHLKSLREIQTKLIGVVEPYKLPRYCKIINEFPLTISGKLKRKELINKANIIINSLRRNEK